MKMKVLLCVLVLNLTFFSHAEAALIRYDVSSGDYTTGIQYDGYLVLDDDKSGTTYLTYDIDSFILTINGNYFSGHSGYINFQYHEDNGYNFWSYSISDPIRLNDDTGGFLGSGSETDGGSWTTQGPDNFSLPNTFGYWMSAAGSNIPNLTDPTVGRFVLSNPIKVPETSGIFLLGVGLLALTFGQRRKFNALKNASS